MKQKWFLVYFIFNYKYTIHKYKFASHLCLNLFKNNLIKEKKSEM